MGQRVPLEVELNAQGKKRAKNVAVVSTAIASAAPRQRQAANSPAQWGTARLFALTAFLLVYVEVAVIWRVPGWVAALYAGTSVVCALVYAIDKSAAVAGRWRVSESTLHTLSLVGGRTGCAAGAAQPVEQGNVSCGVLGNVGGQRGGLCRHPFAAGCGLAGLTAGGVAVAAVARI